MTRLKLFTATTTAALMMVGGQALAQDQPTAPSTPPVAATPPSAPMPPTAPTPAPAPETPATTPAPAPSTPAPSTTPAPMAAPAPAAMPMVVAKGDIVETLKGSGQFTILLKALDAANLTAVLKTNQNLTLFAPTDAAFKALPAGQLDKLMASPNDLQALLTNHLVNASVDSSKVEGTTGDVKAVGGMELMLDGKGDKLMVGTATVTQADIRAANGIVHVVDKVILSGAAPTPPMAAAPAETAEEPMTTP